MPYLNRYAARRRSTLSAEFVYLLVVIAAGAATALWAGPKLGADLSGITTLASILGLNQHGGVTHRVGYAVTNTDESSAAPAAYCQPGQAPTFSPAFGNLKQLVGDTMGAPVECEHATSASGDSVQQTTTGLAAYFSATNTVTFTDGWRHWAVTSGGYVTWEGTDSQPPTASGPGAG